jgi:hypothetical protein
MDIVGVLSKVAEAMVTLKKAGSAWISRKGFYVRPSKRALKSEN